MQPVSAHGLVAKEVGYGQILPRDRIPLLRDRFSPRQEVMVRSRLVFNDEAAEVVPEASIRDRHLPHLLAFSEDRQALAVMIEMFDGLGELCSRIGLRRNPPQVAQ